MRNDLDTERTVLGAMLLSEDGYRAGAELSPSDFSLDWHRTAFNRMRMLAGQGVEVNCFTLTTELMRCNELEAAGGAVYLAEHMDGLPRGDYVPSTAVRLLREASQRRGILAMIQIAQDRALRGDVPEEILTDLAGTVLTSQAAAARIRPVPISEYIIPVLDELERQRSVNADQTLGISTGILELDSATTGWRNGELVYVGALPGRGKTSFMLQCMYAAAIQGIGVGCISLEMRATQLVQRLAVLHSKLAPYKIRDSRNMNAGEYAQIRSALISLGDLPIQITDVSGLNPGQIASQARQMHTAGARLITVDFIQIVREEGRDRREQINRVSATLRDTCKSLNVPFLVASQLSRGDKDLNRRPTMQDLRESGSLEQDAHMVLLLYRPVDQNGEYTREDEIIVAKQREGVTGRVDVAYDDATLTFGPRNLTVRQPVPIRASAGQSTQMQRGKAQ